MAISRRLLNEGEHVVIDTRTHVKALILPLLVLVVLLAIGTYAQVNLDSTYAMWAIWIVLGAGIVWFVLRPLIVWATATYTFTDRRLITRHGVIVRRGHDMPLARISDIATSSARSTGCWAAARWSSPTRAPTARSSCTTSHASRRSSGR